jgi:hypothetical protein
LSRVLFHLVIEALWPGLFIDLFFYDSFVGYLFIAFVGPCWSIVFPAIVFDFAFLLRQLHLVLFFYCGCCARIFILLLFCSSSG